MANGINRDAQSMWDLSADERVIVDTLHALVASVMGGWMTLAAAQALARMCAARDDISPIVRVNAEAVVSILGHAAP